MQDMEKTGAAPTRLSVSCGFPHGSIDEVDDLAVGHRQGSELLMKGGAPAPLCLGASSIDRSRSDCCG